MELMELTEGQLFRMANDTDLLLALMEAEEEIKAKNQYFDGFQTIGERKILIKKLIERGFNIEKVKK